MKSALYFICPTDCLESIIEETFQQENYFYSSLGNSVDFSEKDLRYTKKLIRKKNINEISFVLSNDNRIVLDAIGNQNFSEVTGLGKFYDQVALQKENLEMSWQIKNPQFFILSSFLNKKIEELKNGLSYLNVNDFTIKGKIYHRQKNIFEDIFSYSFGDKELILN